MTSQCNVDACEIAKFDRIAQAWWDPQGSMRTLQIITPLRLGFVASHMDISGARIADIGCGGGIFSEALARAGAMVTGIDQSAQAIDVARGHAAEQSLNITYRVQTAEGLAMAEPHGFDCVICAEMLEHVPDPGAVVAASARLLKPQGWAFFATINRTLKAWFCAVLMGEYVVRLLPRGSHRYAQLIMPQELHAWARASGLEHIRSASLAYSPLTRRFGLEYDREDINYMLSLRNKKEV
ncbi:bifunctional 3-demethylubiquinone 3-O-methyltransferase/2-octaprenyl-6-hydroxy phenol methylase [Desulfovibrionales bacterium]